MGLTKMVESGLSLSQTQAEVLHGISNYLSISNIAQHRKKSRQAIYKTLRKLLKEGLVEKTKAIKGYVYGLTNKGKEGLHSFMGLTTKLRQHNLGIKVEVLESYKNWDKKRNIIMTMPYFNKRVQLKNTSYDLLQFGKVRLKITSKSVIFQLPTIFAENVDNAMIQAMDILFNTITKVENRFNIKLIKDNKINMTIISQEYARLDDALARIYKKEGKKLYITGDDGKVWLIADYSLATNELETIHPNRAGDDMSIIHPFLNDLRDNPMKLSELKEVIEGVVKIQLNDRETMNHLSINFKTHFKVLKEIGKAIKDLTKKVGELK